MSLANQDQAGLPPTVLARWQFTTVDARATTVLPDGCSDLILHVDARGHAGWHVSPLTDTAMAVPGCAGEWWLGYRMQPGTTIDTDALLRSAQAISIRACFSRLRSGMDGEMHVAMNGALDTQMDTALLAAIDAHTCLNQRAEEALHALAHAPTVGKAAQRLGVSERSLERLTKRATAQPPRFWRALARVRRAAQALTTAQPLADIAADHGYADQAHFSRECQRWLGQTPAVLRRSPHLLATVAQVGYG